MRICCDWRCCWRREGLVLALLVGLSGCSTPWLPTFYRVPVTQGQVVDEARIAQLQVGMSQAEGRAAVARPLPNQPMGLHLQPSQRLAGTGAATAHRAFRSGDSAAN